MELAFTPTAWDHYQWWLVNDKQVLGRINKLLLDTLRDPKSGLGKPEPLRGFTAEVWSRRISLEHRLVYRIEQNVITVVGCKHHY